MHEYCSRIPFIYVAPLILSAHNSWCWTHTHTHTHTYMEVQVHSEQRRCEWYTSELSINHCPHDTRHLNYITINICTVWVLYYLLISWLVTFLHIHLSSITRPVFFHYLPSILSFLCSHYGQSILRCTWLEKCCSYPPNWYTYISL
jgi:hypothetical protein